MLNFEKSLSKKFVEWIFLFFFCESPSLTHPRVHRFRQYGSPLSPSHSTYITYKLYEHLRDLKNLQRYNQICGVSHDFHCNKEIQF